MEMTKEAAKAAVLRALDWLEANPDNHITGDMATDYDGNMVLATSEDARCFCVLGRIAKECGLGGDDRNEWGHYTPIGAVYPVFEALGFEEVTKKIDTIMDMNDRVGEFAHITEHPEHSGCAPVIAFMRVLMENIAV